MPAEPADRRPHVVVVGGGVAGLSAAWFLAGGPEAPRVTVLEASPRVGGKLRVSELAGVGVDEGAESLLVRRPEGVDLVRDIGLADQLVAPATTSATIWSRGRMRALPAGQVMGVPGDLRSLASTGLLTLPELARVSWDSWLPGRPLDDDVPVGRYVASRLGRAVVDRLVEPLLGGVYAGRADLLSLEATVPQLFAAARQERSLLRATARLSGQAAAAAGRPRQVFASLPGGLGRLPGELADALRGAGVLIRTGATVRELRRGTTGWQLVVGPTRSPELVHADAVVVAVPAAPAARLLAEAAPAAATALSGIDYASMAVLALAYPAAAFPQPPRGSGFLVPPVEGRVVKAATFSSTKWGWYAAAAPGTVVVRLSVGRLGEQADLQRDDEDLLATAVADLRQAGGVRGEPLEARVTRWGGGLPQYAVGHVGRVRRVRDSVAGAEGLAVCGAAYDGVGIPAVVASARRAADDVRRHLAPAASRAV